MIKILGFIPRRNDLTRAAFRDYYETRHVVLALKNIRSFAKYVRNHVVQGVPQDPDFDCLPEWWFDGPEIATQIAEWVASPAGIVLRNDEANFMNQSHMASCGVTEQLLFGPPRSPEAGIVRKIGFLLSRAPASTSSDFESELARFGQEVLRRNQGALTRVSLDVPVDPLQKDLRLNALLWVWPSSAATPLDLPQVGTSVSRMTRITFDSIESPLAALRD